MSNHAHVLICLAQDSATRIQDVAERVGITYRAVQRILDELEEAGYITRGRKKEDARSNEYRVNTNLPLRHTVERHPSRLTLVYDLHLRHHRQTEGRAAQTRHP